MTYPSNVISDINDGFEITDEDDGFQRVKIISDTVFIYKCEFDGETIEMEIDVEKDCDNQEEIIESYYGSLASFKEEFKDDLPSMNMIIAECYFEQSL
jgi:hypothetical protein